MEVQGWGRLRLLSVASLVVTLLSTGRLRGWPSGRSGGTLGGVTQQASVPRFGPWVGFGDEALARGLPKLAAYPISGIVRRVRRLSDLSQRQLALLVGVSASLIGRMESGSVTPSVGVLQRILAAAQLQLVVVDQDGRCVHPMGESDDVRDGAGRRYPSHLDTILDPEEGEWWGDCFGLARPPETFYRDRVRRDMARRYSRWWVRAAQNRGVPQPPNPSVLDRRPPTPDFDRELPFDPEECDDWD